MSRCWHRTWIGMRWRGRLDQQQLEEVSWRLILFLEIKNTWGLFWWHHKSYGRFVNIVDHFGLFSCQKRWKIRILMVTVSLNNHQNRRQDTELLLSYLSPCGGWRGRPQWLLSALRLLVRWKPMARNMVGVSCDWLGMQSRITEEDE